MLAVYVHFPWCLQKCPYCDFASAGIRRAEVPHRQYAEAVLRELRWRAPALTQKPLGSVFFGGGTPSLWEPAELGRVLRAIRGAFDEQTPDLEVTVECNPTSLDRDRAAALREAGVNRLSIGVQSLDDGRLRYLGRLHDAAGGLRAVQAARAEIARVSADLIFGLPGQSPAEARDEAARLADEGLDHLSVYALTIEPDTQFGALQKKGRLKIAADDDVAESFLAIEATLAGRGLSHYEVSNYARPGQESRHNLHYWRGGAYLGLGAGAVGCLHAGPGDARRYRNDPRPERYVQLSGEAAVEVFEEALDASDLTRERLMLGLRTAEGMNLRAARAATGVEPLAGRELEVKRALSRGELLREDEVLRVPPQRWLSLDSIVASVF